VAKSFWSWGVVFALAAAMIGCAEQKRAPVVDETDPGVAASALEEDSKQTGVR